MGITIFYAGAGGGVLGGMAYRCMTGTPGGRNVPKVRKGACSLPLLLCRQTGLNVGVTTAAGMAALTYDLGGSLIAFAVRTAEVLAFGSDATTGWVLAFLGIAHLVISS